jgi:ferritin-like metal-binding protein YciE
MSYFAKKRDDAITANEKAVTALELEVAKNYATKPTVMALFQEATQQTKDAVARVEKSIDSTNVSVRKVEDKIDGVFKSIGEMQSNVMSELSKKT